MRILTLIVVACIGLALMQAAAKLVVLMAIILGLATFAARPQESIGCVVTFLMLGMVGRFPVAAVLLVAIFSFIGRFWRITDSRGSEPPTHEN